MRTNTLFAVLALCCATACLRVEAPASDAEAGNGSLVISIRDGQPATKSSIDPSGKDATLHDVQVFLFTLDGQLYLRESLGTDVTTKTLDGVKAGYYTVAALANGPELSTVQTLDALKQTVVQLGDNDPTKGFLMYGVCPQSVSVVSGAAQPVTAEIEVQRLVARVRLTGVVNRLPSDIGALTVKAAFLENVPGTWNCAAVGNPTTYLNHAGRQAGKSLQTGDASLIKTSAHAECAALTFQTVNRSVARGGTGETFDLPLYSFPNACSEADDNFSGPTDGTARTRLVLLVGYGTSDEWYYPVTLPGLARNTSYDVSFSISGPGTSDPNQRVVNGNLAVEIHVAPWVSGGSLVGDF